METKNEVSDVSSKENLWKTQLQDVPEETDKIEDIKDLEAKIDELESYYQPFMRDLTEDLSCRERAEPIKDWQFRYEEDGEWSQVTIPEYKRKGFWRGFYKTEFEVPDSLKKKERIVIRFEGVDTRCFVKVNGEKVGSHRGAIEPFEFDITDPVRFDKTNLLEVTVENGLSPIGPNEHRMRTPELPVPEPGEFFKVSGEWGDMYGRRSHQGGIWRDVYLVGTSDVWVEDVTVKPEIKEGKVQVAGTIKAKRNDQYSIEVEVLPKNFEEDECAKPWHKEAEIQEENAQFNAEISIPDQKLWWPKEPYLYVARVTIRDDGGEVRDCEDEQFGQRSFEYDNELNRYLLNGKPFRFLGVTTANSLNTAYVNGDIEKVKRIILLAKAANFNMLRHHIMSTVPELDRYFDMLGMPVQQEVNLWQRIKPDIVDEALRQLPILVNQHRNHPSVLTFAICSEPWEEDKAAYKRYRKEAAELMEERFSCLEWKIEGGRSASGEEVAERHSKHGIVDIHEYSGWYYSYADTPEVDDRNETVTIGEFGAESLSNYETMEKSWPEEDPYCQFPKDPDRPINSTDELPWGQYKKRPQTCNDWFVPRPRTLHDWIDSTQAHQARVSRFRAEYYRRSKNVAGYFYYLLDEPAPNAWRKTLMGCDLSPKPAFYEMAKVNVPVFVQVYTEQDHYFAGDILEADFWSSSTRLDPIEAELRWFVKNPDGEVVFASSKDTLIKAGQEKLERNFRFKLSEDASDGMWQILLFVLDKNENVISDYKQEFKVWKREQSDRKRTDDILLISDQKNNLAKILNRQGFHPQKIYSGPFGSFELSSHQLDSYDLVALCGEVTPTEPQGQLLQDYVAAGGNLLVQNVTSASLDWLVPGLATQSRRKENIGITQDHPIFKGFSQEDDFTLWNRVNDARFVTRNGFTYGDLEISRTYYEKTFKADSKKDSLEAKIYSIADSGQRSAAVMEIHLGEGLALLSGLDLLDRYDDHPVATKILNRQISYSLKPTNTVPKDKFDCCSKDLI